MSDLTPRLVAVLRRLVWCRHGHAWIVHIEPETPSTQSRVFLECRHCLTCTPGWVGV